jgi:SAM-dependent methyltransferase
VATKTKEQVAPIFKTRTTCRACNHPSLEEVLDLGVQYLPRWVKEKDETLPKSPLRLMRCGNCGLLQLHDTVEPDLLFREFWYRSGINETMREALLDIVRDGTAVHTKGRWLDIGANDGYLLSRVPSSFTKIGCEPALNFQSQLEELCDRTVPDYFKAEDYEPASIDVITSAAMFYDVDEPGQFVADIAKVLKPGGIWINQLNDSPTMLKQNAFDSICHEHLCYYDIPSLAALYRSHGLSIREVSFNDVNGGSVRVLASHQSRGGADMLGIPSPSREEVMNFAFRIKNWKALMSELIGHWTAEEPLWGYGASTKGSVLLQYLDVGKQILAIADRNPQKCGLLLAGPWIPITDEVTLRNAKPKHVLVLPWAFKKEFVEREESLRRAGTTMVFPLPSIELVL